MVGIGLAIRLPLFGLTACREKHKDKPGERERDGGRERERRKEKCERERVFAFVWTHICVCACVYRRARATGVVQARVGQAQELPKRKESNPFGKTEAVDLAAPLM